MPAPITVRVFIVLLPSAHGLTLPALPVNRELSFTRPPAAPLGAGLNTPRITLPSNCVLIPTTTSASEATSSEMGVPETVPTPPGVMVWLPMTKSDRLLTVMVLPANVKTLGSGWVEVMAVGARVGRLLARFNTVAEEGLGLLVGNEKEIRMGVPLMVTVAPGVNVCVPMTKSEWESAI